MSRGKFEDARKAFEEALAIRRKVLPKTIPRCPIA